MKKFIFLFIGIFFSFQSFADSPITSTDFHTAYHHIELIKEAAESNGVITEEHMQFLTDKRQPIAHKMALINALSWDFNGKNNAEIFFDFLKPKYKKEKRLLRRADAGTIIAYAYLLAMDNYFEVDKALLVSQRAKKKSKKSYAIHIVAGLIEAQKAFDSDWCKVYAATNRVRQDQSLVQDMSPEAIEIIFDYMDLYQGSCGF